jgi:predicted transcriptional regulator
MIDTKRAQMLGGDPADRKEASYWPTHEDRPEDIWADEWLEMCRASEVKVCPDAVSHGKAALTKTLKTSDKDGHRLAQREAIVRFLQQAREVSACPDLQYFVATWQAAFELEDKDEDKTQTSIAKQFGVTRAAVSKRVVEIRKAANPTTIARSQKSIEARKTYALRQLIVGQTRKKIDLTNQQKETNDLWAQHTTAKN